VRFDEIKIGGRAIMVIRKAGRKPKKGKRYPSGKVIPEKMTSEQIIAHRKVVAATMPHRRGLPAEVRHREMAESPLGALQLIGAITQQQFDALHEYRKIVARYRAVISAPNPNPQAPQLGHVRGVASLVLSDEQAIARRERYLRAFEAITGHHARTVVNSVVIHDRPLQAGDLPYLTGAADSLIKHFGMDSGRQKKIA
jgi:hypothetical protein